MIAVMIAVSMENSINGGERVSVHIRETNQC